MRSLPFPHARVAASQLVCGCDRLRFVGERVLDEAFAAGINVFDTAAAYARCEHLLGRWLRDRGVREQALVITKGGYQGGRSCLDATLVLSSLRRSLDELQTDVIDLFLLHYDDPAIPAGTIVELLERLRDTGHVRAVGGANFELSRVQAIHSTARQLGGRGFDAVSAQLSLPVPVMPLWPGSVSHSGAAGAAALGWYRDQGIAFIGYSCLGRGFFTQEYQLGIAPTPRRVPRDLAWVRARMDSADNQERYRRARALADRLGKTPAQVALAWVLRQQVFATTSWTETATLRENEGALDIELTDDEAASLQPAAASAPAPR